MARFLRGFQTHRRRLLRNCTAATAIEYGLVASIISLGVLAAIGSMGGSLRSTFNTTSSAFSGGNTSAA